MLNANELIGFDATGTMHLRAISILRNLRTTSFTAPADIKAGDLLILVLVAFSYTDAVYPDGFTSFDQQQGSLSATFRIISTYKIATGTEGGTTMSPCMNSSAANGEAQFFLVLRPSFPITKITTNTVTWQFTHGDPADVTIPAPFYTGVSVAIVRDDTATHAAGIFTPAEDQRNGEGSVQMYYKIFNHNSGPVTLAMGDTGDHNTLYGFSVSVT